MSIRAFFIVIVAVGLTFWLGFRNYPADIRVFYQNGDRLDAPLISAILAAAASIIAIIALIVNSSVNLRNKRLDVTIHCNTRYDDIYKTRGEIAKKTGKDASVPAPTERGYWMRYWGLKSDQFDYWLAGYIDSETITSWMMYTTDMLRKLHEVERRNILDALREEHSIVNQRFIDLVDFIEAYVLPLEDRREAFVVTIHYLRIVEKLDKRFIAQLTKISLFRNWMKEFSEAMTPGYREEYVNVSPEYSIGKLYNSVVRFLRAPILGWWHLWTGHTHLKRMKRQLENKHEAVRTGIEKRSSQRSLRQASS